MLLRQFGFPGILIRNKEKKLYSQAFNDYRGNKNTKTMEKIVAFALMGSNSSNVGLKYVGVIHELPLRSSKFKESVGRFHFFPM